MTAVTKSAMRKTRDRYRGYRSKSNKNHTLGIINVLFLICFTIYQFILSKSNGGRDAVSSTYRSFLKGGQFPKGSGNSEYDGEGAIRGDNPGPALMNINEEYQESLHNNESEFDDDQDRAPQIEQEHDQFLRQNKAEFQEDLAEVPQITEVHDQMSQEKKIHPEDDRLEVPEFLNGRDSFSKENEVNSEDDPADVPEVVNGHDPFLEESEVKSVNDQADIPEIVSDHDPFSKENEVDFEENIAGAAEFVREHSPISKENEVELKDVIEHNPFSKENEVVVEDNSADVIEILEEHEPLSTQNKVEFEDNIAGAAEFVREHNPFSKENEVVVADNSAEMPEFLKEHDPFSKENEVVFEDNISGAAEFVREHNPFSKENEVVVADNSAEVPEFLKEHDPFSKKNEVVFEDNNAEMPKILEDHDPFSKENEVVFEDESAEVPDILKEHNPFSKENEVIFSGNNADVPNIFREHDPFSKENEVVFEDVFEENSAGAHDPFSKENEVDASQVVSAAVPSYVFDPDHQMFHNYFKGKSGKVVRDMLMAHAYIFHKNATYGGCCGTASAKISAHEDLLSSLGLNGPLRFRCPRDFVHDTRTRRSVIPKDKYTAEDTRIWTPEYVDYLRSLVTYPEKRHQGYTIVVHMLRGNTSPCKEKTNGYNSYLPNLHYLKVIQKYMQPGARVIIYTSSKSFEDLNEFRNRGYEVNTGTSLKDTWKDYVTADIFIMSRSDFSLVPAMVAKGTVVYTPFWHRALRRWKRVGKSIMKQTEEEIIRLQETKCVFPIG